MKKKYIHNITRNRKMYTRSPRMSRFFAYILFSILVVQPLAPIFAFETENVPPQDTSVGEDVPQTVVDIPIPEEVILPPETVAVADVVLPTEEVVLTEQVETDSEILTDATSLEILTVTETSTTTESVVTEESVPDDSTASTSTEEAEASTTLDMPTLPVPEEEDGVAASLSTSTATSAPAVVDEETVVEEIGVQETEVVATTTIEIAAVAATTTDIDTVEPTVFAQDLNLKSFPKEACITTGDGTFYCKEPTDAPGILGSDRVFSAPDNEGDKEIFVERDGEVTQISFNQYDDASPRFDEISNTLVWHRLIEGRYQIIRYDIDTEEEEQLTHESYNSMEPSQYGSIITWQGWVGADWEIILWENGSTTILTDNTIQDVAPRIMGDYMLWESYEDGAWRVKVYDHRTKIIDTIADADGASVDNPRFVLVYDTKYENGDVETKGYDLDTGKVVPLSATPVQTPQDLPSPDQTGEDRALVQPQVSVKTKSATTTDSGAGGNNPPEGESEGVSASTTPDLIITPFVEEMVATSSLPVFEAEIIEAAGTTTMESVISDLIITPFVEEISIEADPQAPVATST